MAQRYYCPICGHVQAYIKGKHCIKCGEACKDITIEVDKSKIARESRQIAFFFLIFFTSLILVTSLVIDYFDVNGIKSSFREMLPATILMLVFLNSLAVLVSASHYYSMVGRLIDMKIKREGRIRYGELNYPITYKPINKDLNKLKKLRDRGTISKEEFSRRKEKMLEYWNQHFGYTDVKISLSEEGIITLESVDGE